MVITRSSLKDLVYQVNGAAIEVHKNIGAGLLENVYHQCLKKELELRNAIEIGVLEVTKLYKDYNHIEMQTFYNKKLSKEEQEEILNTSKTTFEVFKKTHEKYLEKNGKSKDIKNTPAPNTPDFTKVIKEPMKNNHISQIDSEDEKYKKALGV